MALSEPHSCHWFDCSFSSLDPAGMLDHTKAHLEAYLPIKIPDYANWMLINMGVTDPAVPDSLLALIGSGDTTRLTSSTPARSQHIDPSSSNQISTPDQTRSPQPRQTSPARLSPARSQTSPPPSPPLFLSQLSSPRAHTPPPRPDMQPMSSPVSVVSHRSFAALNSISDTSPNLDTDVFSSPSPGTVWHGIGNHPNVYPASPSRPGRSKVRMTPQRFTGRWKGKLPGTPSRRVSPPVSPTHLSTARPFFPLKPLSPLPPLKRHDSPGPSGAVSDPAPALAPPVTLITGEDNEMDVDTDTQDHHAAANLASADREKTEDSEMDELDEVDTHLGAGRPNDLHSHTAIITTPSPRKSYAAASLRNGASRVTLALGDIDSPQPDWVTMQTQAPPPSSLGDI